MTQGDIILEFRDFNYGKRRYLYVENRGRDSNLFSIRVWDQLAYMKGNMKNVAFGLVGKTFVFTTMLVQSRNTMEL